jgi:hypothetical protein
MRRTKPFDNPAASFMAARERLTCFSPSHSITSFAVMTFSHSSVFDFHKNPDIPRALEDYKRHLEKHCV